MRLRPLASIALCFLSTSGAVNIGEIDQPCATSCVSSAISAAGCGDNDMTCQCGMPFTAISKLAAPCIATACTAAGDDLEYAASAGAAICMSVIGRIGLPTITTATRAPPTQAAASEARIAVASIPPQTTTISEAPPTTTSSLSAESTATTTSSVFSSSSTSTPESSSSTTTSNSTTTPSSAGGSSSSPIANSSGTTSPPVASGTSSPQQSTSSVPVLGVGAIAAISLGGVMVTFSVAGCAFLFGRRERKKRAAAEQPSNESGIGFGFSRSGTGFGSEYKSSSSSLVSHGVSPIRPWPEVPRWPETRPWPEDEKKVEFEQFELPGREHYEPKELWAEPVAVRRPEPLVKEEGRRGA